MKFLCLDVETLMFPKADPFHSEGKLICIGWSRLDQQDVTIKYCADDDFSVSELQEEIDSCDFLVGHNIKFDAHWLMNIGVDLSNVKFWDTGLFHYALVAQRERFISLNRVCEYYGLPQKFDFIKENYWNKEIDTDAVPRNLLTEYLHQDIVCTKSVLDKQLEQRKTDKPSWFTSFRLDCVDLHNTIEMERTGTLLDVEGISKCLEKSEERVAELTDKLTTRFGGIAVNLNSPDQLSACLYGGTITEELRLPVGVFKSGARIGQTKFGKFEKVHTLEPIFVPPKRSELKKEGVYSTSADNLLRIKAKKADKWILDALIELASLDKLIGSYLRKMPKMLQERCWLGNTLHGKFNHGVTVTSRLSSDSPNSQNFPGEFKQFIITRFN